jgi:hypothetical protein
MNGRNVSTRNFMPRLVFLLAKFLHTRTTRAIVCHPTHSQAELEAAEGLPSLPFMQSLDVPTVRARQQIIFVDYVIAPLWAAVGTAFPETADMPAPLAEHRLRYQLLADKGSPSGASPGAVSAGLGSPLSDSPAWPPEFA